jgi:DNA-binding response OmpR family regulator
MTRVLLVYHDPTVADTEGDMLRAAGYEVDRCAGPVGGGPCPILQGLPCWQVDQADVLVYDTWDPVHNGRPLVDELREFHPDKPLVLTTPVRFATGERGDRAPVVAAESRSALIPAIERAMAGRPAAPLPHREPAGPIYHGPRW